MNANISFTGETFGLNTQDIFSVAKKGVKTGDLDFPDPCSLCKQPECPCRDSEEPYVPLVCDRLKLDDSLMQYILSY